MIYIIDRELTYNSDDCTLSHHSDDEPIKLSIPAGRLFEQLLTSNGEVLSREYLLTEVWDKYGLRGSNSNLNQYISLLRRALAGYGCDNLIVTVPKMGFRLNTDIEISHEPDAGSQKTTPWLEKDVPQQAESNTGISEPSPSAAPMTDKPQRSTGQRRFFWFAALASIVSASILIAALAHLRSNPQEREITPVEEVLDNGCEITYLKNISRDDRPAVNRQIQQILTANKLSCGANRRIVFDNYTSDSTQNYGRTMLSFCQLGNHREIIACDNFYYYDWRIN
ncbi:transcriptional regulator [Brenneria tiliae]|uniref:Winged helix-turn-helix domain-containing protein n=1 Tax=Brenneria tiliae TaxID=2914984 RepID=A0ABT0MT24_9GAMM|nr:winged helix-turn-helix domain-containing protein [Brenneria tiliae]MCL2892947.1 winged helix-turn-helix domain-containing protein [Brenneria tiliae]